MKDDQQKKPVSPQKLVANRKNGLRSKGPKTPEGKQRASQNSYKHGFFWHRPIGFGMIGQLCPPAIPGTNPTSPTDSGWIV
jgi:hypothetical protein